jgi:glycosyltransferase involved in cell wall biosynthesis
MKVLLINTSERTGGAAIAANRLMKALINNGIEAKTLVLSKQTTDENVISIQVSFLKRIFAHVHFLLERWVIFVSNCFSRKNLFKISIANTGFDISDHCLVKEADLIHIHWINQGFLSLQGLQRLIETGKPVFCTMHDLWFCTGICHYSRSCNFFHTQCHDCLYLHKPHSHDLSHKVFIKKRAIYKSGKITFITCSRWLQRNARKSALLSSQQIVAIPNPIDTSLFRPMDRSLCRKKFHLPENKKLVLFGAVKISDERKGIAYLIKAIEFLSRKPEAADIELVIFGKSTIDLSKKFSLNVNFLNYLSNEEDIAILYNSANVFVTPSLEDNLPNTIMEAMACGIPCVGFDIGGIPEMIDHHLNGYIATYEDSEDLAEGILWCLENDQTISTEARKKVENSYAEEIVVRQYVELFQQLTPSTNFPKA